VTVASLKATATLMAMAMKATADVAWAAIAGAEDRL
jgi:hypothetical protein